MKKWFIKVCVMIVGLLLATSVTTVAIDPFFHYHKPLEGLWVYYNRQPYQNPGMLQHFDYDTVILGSSMSENFKTSLFQEYLGDNAVKASHQAASTYNLWQYATIALESNEELDKIYWGVDAWAVEYEPDYSHDPVPEYLVDNNPLTDVNYLWNKTVFQTYNGAFLRMTFLGNQNADNMDAVWNWAETSRFSQQEALRITSDVNGKSLYSADERSAHFEEIFENQILSVVKENPDVKFVFYFPPYSIRFWKEAHENGLLEERLEHYKEMSRTLLAYENVEIYNFQSEEWIITNLYLYKDMTHYSQRISDYMVECFTTGEHRLTVDNYEAKIDRLKGIVESFDYSQYDNEFINCSDLQEYIDLCKDENYTIYVTGKLDGTPSEEISNALTTIDYSFDSAAGIWSYGIIENGAMLEQQFSYEPVLTYMEHNQQEIAINMNQEQCISIDGINYGYTTNGINLVVWSKEKACVIDSVNINFSTGVITHY